MDPTRETPTGQDRPSKAVKIIPAGDITKTTSLRALLAIVLTFSISLVAYSTLHPAARPAFFGWLSAVPDPARYMARLESDQSRTNISHLAFGLGGSTRTWEARGRYSDLWWKPGTTRGFVFLEKQPDPRARRFKIRHRVSSKSRRSEPAVRIARVVVDLFRVGLPDVRWFVMGDDDTVFFPENVAAVLAKYDHREMVYVGGQSESVEQDVMHAYGMAFGGGGFAVSYPLAAQLVGAMDGCLNRYHNFYGSDQRVWACVAELGVGLTRESGFHQIDIRGNPFGLLAAHPVAPLVSLHHLDYIHPLFPNQTQLDSLRSLMRAYEVDPSRMLQQCFCYHRQNKWSVSVSWGYAVQIFPALLTAKDLETPMLTFKTWRSWKKGPFTFNTRPMSSDPCQKPIVFYLDSVEDEGINKRTVSTYRKHAMEPMKNCSKSYALAMAVDEVVVLASELDPREWKQRPRRQCCEINGSFEHGTMRIRVRKCRDSETITI